MEIKTRDDFDTQLDYLLWMRDESGLIDYILLLSIISANPR